MSDRFLMLVALFSFAIFLQQASAGSSHALSWAPLRLGVGLGRVPARLALRGGGSLEITTTCDQTAMGECVAIVGNGEVLGNWKNPIKMDGKGYPKWKTSVQVNEGAELEYKYCIVAVDGSIARWEGKGSGANRKCKVNADMLSGGLKDSKAAFDGGGGGGGGGGHKQVSSGGRCGCFSSLCYLLVKNQNAMEEQEEQDIIYILYKYIILYYFIYNV